MVWHRIKIQNGGIIYEAYPGNGIRYEILQNAKYSSQNLIELDGYILARICDDVRVSGTGYVGVKNGEFNICCGFETFCINGIPPEGKFETIEVAKEMARKDFERMKHGS